MSSSRSALFSAAIISFLTAGLLAAHVRSTPRSPAPLPQRGGPIQVALVDLAGNRKLLATVPTLGFAPRVSPDGKQVAYDLRGAIWIADMTNLSAARQLTSGGSDNFPLWTPDGQRIVFTSARDGGEQALYWQRADGTGDAEQLVKPARSPESWSVPGELLSFITLKPPMDYDIWTYSLKDKKAAPLIEIPVTAQDSSRFSHDGKWIAYESNETGRSEVWVQPSPLAGARFQITMTGGSRPLWSPDDRELFYDHDNRMFVASVQTTPAFKASEPMPLPIDGFIQGGARRQYDITPDGKAFLMMFRSAE